MHRWSLFVLALASVACLTTALTFTAEAGRDTCFYDDLKTGDAVTFMYQVTFGGALDIDLTVRVDWRSRLIKVCPCMPCPRRLGLAHWSTELLSCKIVILVAGHMDVSESFDRTARRSQNPCFKCLHQNFGCLLPLVTLNCSDHL
jgi:hypothetical protein